MFTIKRAFSNTKETFGNFATYAEARAAEQKLEKEVGGFFECIELNAEAVEVVAPSGCWIDKELPKVEFDARMYGTDASHTDKRDEPEGYAGE